MSGVNTFTGTMLLAASIGGGWLVGVGVRARTAVRERPAAVALAPAGSTDAGIRLGGPVKATHVLHVFGDYECPACQALEHAAGDSLRVLASAGRLAIVYRHAPLSAHWRGPLAAEVAYCGALSGVGPQVHDALVATAGVWSASEDPVPLMIDAVVRRGLSADSVAGCVASGRAEGRIEADQRLAAALGVTAVPAVYLDSARLEFRSWAALLRHVTRRTALRRHR